MANSAPKPVIELVLNDGDKGTIMAKGKPEIEVEWDVPTGKWVASYTAADESGFVIGAKTSQTLVKKVAKKLELSGVGSIADERTGREKLSTGQFDLYELKV